jgi:hypothetical protein
MTDQHHRDSVADSRDSVADSRDSVADSRDSVADSRSLGSCFVIMCHQSTALFSKTRRLRQDSRFLRNFTSLFFHVCTSNNTIKTEPKERLRHTMCADDQASLSSHSDVSIVASLRLPSTLHQSLTDVDPGFQIMIQLYPESHQDLDSLLAGMDPAEERKREREGGRGEIEREREGGRERGQSRHTHLQLGKTDLQGKKPGHIFKVTRKMC